MIATFPTQIFIWLMSVYAVYSAGNLIWKLIRKPSKSHKNSSSSSENLDVTRSDNYDVCQSLDRELPSSMFTNKGGTPIEKASPKAVSCPNCYGECIEGLTNIRVSELPHVKIRSGRFSITPGYLVQAFFCRQCGHCEFYVERPFDIP